MESAIEPAMKSAAVPAVTRFMEPAMTPVIVSLVATSLSRTGPIGLTGAP